MSNPKRAGVLLATAALLVLTFIVLRPADESPRSAATPAATATATTAGRDAEPVQPEAKAPPPAPLLEAGSTRRLRFRKGDAVRFRVRSASAEELHVHGYDITREIPAGRTITVRFPARIEGIFEVELHRSHTPVGSIEVRP